MALHTHTRTNHFAYRAQQPAGCIHSALSEKHSLCHPVHIAHKRDKAHSLTWGFQAPVARRPKTNFELDEAPPLRAARGLISTYNSNRIQLSQHKGPQSTKQATRDNLALVAIGFRVHIESLRPCNTAQHPPCHDTHYLNTFV